MAKHSGRIREGNDGILGLPSFEPFLFYVIPFPTRFLKGATSFGDAVVHFRDAIFLGFWKSLLEDFRPCMSTEKVPPVLELFVNFEEDDIWSLTPQSRSRLRRR
jgi:hypothetical protein